MPPLHDQAELAVQTCALESSAEIRVRPRGRGLYHIARAASNFPRARAGPREIAIEARAGADASSMCAREREYDELESSVARLSSHERAEISRRPRRCRTSAKGVGYIVSWLGAARRLREANDSVDHGRGGSVP